MAIDFPKNIHESIDRRSVFRLAALVSLAAMMGSQAPRLASATEAALASAEAEYNAAMAQLSSMNEQVELAQYEYDRVSAELDATNAKLAELQSSIEAKTAELNEKQEVLATHMASNYKVGKGSFLDTILGSTTWEDFVNRITFQNKLSDDDTAQVQEVLTLKTALETEQSEYQSKKTEQEALVEQAAANQQALQEQVSSMRSYVDSLSAEVAALMQQRQAEMAAEQQRQAAERAAAAASATTSTGGSTAVATDGGGTVYVADTGGTTESYSEPSYDGGYEDSSDSSSYGSSGTGTHVGGVVSVAESWLGTPYVYGGNSSSGIDCSGLAQQCYAACGYSIPRTTYSQIAQIQSLGNWVSSEGGLAPGDLWFPSSGHVGIYVGGGYAIHAPYEGRVVEYTTLYAFMGGGCPV